MRYKDASHESLNTENSEIYPDKRDVQLKGFDTNVSPLDHSSNNRSIREAFERQQRENLEASARRAEQNRVAESRRQEQRRADEQRQQAAQADAQRRQQETRASEERQRTAQQQALRIQEEANRKRQSVPTDTSPKASTRLPGYETPESLSRKGYSRDTISTINPKSTPISYPEANKRNFEEKFNFHSDGNKGKNHINTHEKDSRIVKAEPNPKGSEPLVHVHRFEHKPDSSEFTTSKISLGNNYDGRQNPASYVQKALDLPGEPAFISEARIFPGKKNLEISKTASGAEQIRAPIEQTHYSKTSPISNLLNWLKK